MKRTLISFAVIAAAVVLVTAPRPDTALAAPDLTVSVSSPATALVDAPATAVTVSVSAQNATATNGYNVGYRAVLPVGASYGGTSSAGAPAQYVQVDGTTVLWWENVSDILAASSGGLTFTVAASNASFPVNATVSVPVQAYIHSDPRTIPTVNASGTIVTASQSGTGSATAATTITAIDIEKSEPSPEGELLRGIHDHETVYTLTVRGNGAHADSGVVVDDYLAAGLEFLGCGAWDNTTDAPTNPGGTEEYPGAGSIDAGVAPDLVAGAPDHCLEPALVETVQVDPDGAGPLTNDVYTHVRWNIGALAVDEVRTIQYYAGVPIRENTLTWSGATPATACASGNCAQAANLDNNDGAETTDELALPNHAIASGVYGGPVAPTTSTTATDAASLTLAAEDLRLLKGVDEGAIERNGLARWELTLATGEYRRVDGPITVTDTLPDGLCPLGTANYTSGNQASDAECDPIVGQEPSLAYAVPPVENADGTWTVTWVLASPALTTSDTATIAFSTIARTSYQQSFADAAPVLADDGWQNTADIPTVPAELDVPVAGLPATNPAVDASSVGQAAPVLAIEKDVSNPVASGELDCDTATWRDADDDADAATYYRPGDRVCYRVQLILNDGAGVGTALQYRDVAVSDYLPPGMVFEQFWGIDPATGETVNDDIVEVAALPIESTSAGQLLVWELGSDVGGARYVDAETETLFEAVFSATIPMPSGATAGAFISRANLVKATSYNSPGEATSLREAAVQLTTRPSLSLNKSRVPSTSPVAATSSITYTVAVTNNAPAEVGSSYGAARDVEVRDVLPFEISCADVTTINNGGVCTDGVTTGVTPVPTRSVIDWTIVGPINPQATSSVSYVVTLPVSLAPSEDLTNTAGVVQYDQQVNTGGTDVTYVPPTATTVDPTAVPNDTVPALDTETVSLVNATTTKVQQSSINETGNGRNATPLNTTETVTVGEQITYTVRSVIPEGSTVYNGVVNDTLPSGFRIVGSPTATLNSVALPGGWSFNTSSLVITLPTPYVNADGSGDDTIEMTFTVVVEDVVANSHGQQRSNVGRFLFSTKSDTLGVNQDRTVQSTARANVVEPLPSILKDENDADDIVVPGQTLTYTLTLRNTRGGPGHDLVATDCVPVGMTVSTPVTPPVTPASVVVTTSTSAPSCTGTLITWTYPAGYSLANGAATTASYVVTVDDPSVAATRLDNDAELTFTSTAGANADERDYTATVTDSVRLTDPVLTKSHTPEPATIGETVTYTLEVTVPADLVMYDAVIADDMPAGLSFEGIDAVACSPAACPTVSVLDATAPQTAPTVGYWIGDVGPYAAEQTIAITYFATVTDDAANVDGDTFDNSAELRWNGTDTVVGVPPTTPPTSTYALDPVVDTLTLVEPELLIDKDVALAGCNTTADPVNAGTDDDACNIEPNGTAFTYTLTVRNVGSSAAYDVVIVDDADLPSSAFASLNVTATGAASTVDGSIVDGDGLEFAYAGPLGVGGTLTITYDVTLRASTDLDHLQQVLNTASVPSYRGLSLAQRNATLVDFPARDFREYTENPADADTVTVRHPRPSIVKTTVSDATDARVGQPFTWQIVVGNTDTVATLFDYDVVDTLPADWSYVAGSAQVTARTAGATPAPGAIANPAIAGRDLTWSDLGDLPPGSTVTIRFQATPQVALRTVGTTGVFPHVNVATITGDDATGSPADIDGPYTATDDATARIRRVDLRLDKSVSPAGPYGLGRNVQYTIAVTNDGPDAATGVVVTDTLPSGLTYVSTVSASQGSLVPATQVWTVGALANGATATLVIEAELNATGTLTNSAEVTGADQWDPDSTPDDGSTTDDDDDTVSVTVVATSLGDRVWFDVDADGTQDGGEPGIPGVDLELRDAGPDGSFGNGDDGPTLTTTTDAAGDYSFGGLRVDRSYRVSVLTATLPGGLTPTYDLDGTGTANTAVTTVPTTTANLTVDFGYTGVGSIGDTVWYDVDASGTAVQDGGEPGIVGVDLTVTWAGFDTVLGTADDIDYTVTTDASGNYLVGDLPFGDYEVVVDSGTVPTGFVPTYDLDGIAGPSAHRAAATLDGGNPDELDVDFSYTGTGSLGDRVWLDADTDGVQDPGEQGIINLPVELVWFGADGVLGGGDDITLTTTTGADGVYLFANLPASNFRVTVSPTPGLSPTYDLNGTGTPSTTGVVLADGQDRTDVDFGYLGGGSIGDRVWFDTLATGDGTFEVGDDRPLVGVDVTVTWFGPDDTYGTGDDRIFTDTTDASGEYLVTELPYGQYRIELDTADLPAGMVPTFDLDGVGSAHVADASIDALAADRRDVDFSYTGVGSIGDTIWYDVDGDGADAPQVGDQLLAGVDVTITWFGPDNVAGGGDDSVFTTTTDAAGAYLVPNLPYGEYTVTVDPASLPAGLDAPTYDLDGVGTADTTDVTLDAGNPDELDADFGYTGTGSIGDTVWLDLDGDGTQDAGEPGLPGVDVTLTFVGPDGATITLTTVTGTDGTYLFDLLPAGTFTVTVDTASLPAGVTPTFDLDGVGTADTTDLTLTAGQDRTDADFGYVGAGSLGDEVWWELDDDGDGVFDADDLPMAGVDLTVRWAGDDGVFGNADDVLVATTTDADGTYLVTGLPYGAYRVSVDPSSLLPGMTPRFDLDGTATPNVVDRTLDAGTPDARDVDFSYSGTGSIGDTVWHDEDGDGVVDGGEARLAGVVVTVVWAGPDATFGNADDREFTDTTDASGNYLVAVLPPGEYRVSIDPATLPDGFVATYDLDGDADRTTTLTLGADEDRLDVDFGERLEADVAITKTYAGDGPVAPGDSVTFRLEVRNLGPGVADGVRVSDPLPAGLTAVSATGTGWVCSITGNRVTCDLADALAAGETAAEISVVAGVDADADGAEFVNVATVSTTTPDPNPDNDQDDATVGIYRIDLAIDKLLLDDMVAGATVRWRLTVTNNGPWVAPVGDVVVTDSLPSSLTAVTAGGSGFACTISGQTVRCVSTTTLPVGAIATIEVATRVGPVADGTSITNSATVGSLMTGDIVPTNDTDAATGVVDADGNLALAGSEVVRIVAVASLLTLAGLGMLLSSLRRRRPVA